MRRPVLYTLCVLVLGLPATLLSQSPSLRTRILYGVEAAAVSPNLAGAQVEDDVASTGSRSPLVATLLSAAAPGAGQIYVQRYWTIPLIWGFGYWFVRQYSFADNKYDEWRETYSRSLAQGPFAGTGDAQAKFIRDFYRDERDRFAFYLAITYVLNLVDAYVGASLFNFDVSEDLTGGNQARLEIRIPAR